MTLFLIKKKSLLYIYLFYILYNKSIYINKIIFQNYFVAFKRAKGRGDSAYATGGHCYITHRGMF